MLKTNTIVENRASVDLQSFHVHKTSMPTPNITFNTVTRHNYEGFKSHVCKLAGVSGIVVAMVSGTLTV